MINEAVLSIVLNRVTFGQREAAGIVGGRGRLYRLIGSGKIRAEKKPKDKQNGRWYCNAYDCILNAEIKWQKDIDRFNEKHKVQGTSRNI